MIRKDIQQFNYEVNFPRIDQTTLITFLPLQGLDEKYLKISHDRSNYNPFPDMLN